MSLLTPPSTGKRHNFTETYCVSRGVKWANPEAFSEKTSKPSEARRRPKSILKKDSNYPLLPFEEEEKREETPEPEDPLSNLHYLAHPIQSILDNEEPRSLVSAYSLISARLRQAVMTPDGECDADGSWPLFQPFRKNKLEFVECLVRDIARAKQDPALTAPQDEETEVENLCIDISCQLPSPQSSPIRHAQDSKKQGATASQVTHARDVCHVSHAAIRFLMTVFMHPSIYSVFSNTHISSLITAVLGIPITPSLPTPNSRKTHALAISSFSTFAHLPPGLLTESVTSRMGYALRRAIDGELGKEGKKGPCSDGLRAIATLSLTYPTQFVPALEPLLPSLLDDLLHPTLSIRLLASHALSAYALASTRIPSEDIHKRLALVIINHLRPSETITLGTPAKPNALVKNLSSTLSGSETSHIAYSPYWALSVIPSLLTLMNAAMYLPTVDASILKVRKILLELISIPFRHPKSSVRQIGAAIMGIMGWLYLQPPAFVSLDDDSPQSSPVSQGSPLSDAHKSFWAIAKSQVLFGAGTNLIAALTFPSSPATSTRNGNYWSRLTRALDILTAMSKGSGPMKIEASRCFLKLLGFISAVNPTEDDQDEYNPRNTLLPPPLFAGQDIDGLLTIDPSSSNATSIAQGVKASMGKIHDITPLPADFMQTPTSKKLLNEIWLNVVNGLALPHTSNTAMCSDPSVVKSIWILMHKSGLSVSSDAEITQSMAFFTDQTRFLVSRVLKDPAVEIVAKDIPSPSKTVSKRLKQFTCSQYVPPKSQDFLFDDIAERNNDTKLNFAHELWQSVCDLVREVECPEFDSTVTISPILLRPASQLLGHLMQSSDVYNDSALWADFCASLMLQIALSQCVEEAAPQLQVFWGYRTKNHKRSEWFASILRGWSQQTYSEIWTSFSRRWISEMDAHMDILKSDEDVGRVSSLWTGACVILAAPYITKTQGLDASARMQWITFMRKTSEFALFHGVALPILLNHLTETLSSQVPATSPAVTLIPVLDILLTQAGKTLTNAHAQEGVLDTFFAFVGESLKQIYPPKPDDRQACITMLTSLTAMIDHCHKGIFQKMMAAFAEGLGIWIGDKERYLSAADWEFNITYLFSITLTSLGATPIVDNVKTALPMLHLAFDGREDMRGSMQESFTSTWNDFFSETDCTGLDLPSFIAPVATIVDATSLLRPSTPPPNVPPTLLYPTTPIQFSPSRSTRVTPSSPRSHKRRRIDRTEMDKENNFSPLFTPVADRMKALTESSTPLPSTPSLKRQNPDDTPPHGSPRGKKVKISPIQGNLLKNSIEIQEKISATVTPTRKRGDFLAVEVPTIQEVYGNSPLKIARSLDSSDYIYKTPVKIGKPRRRRVQSVDSRLMKYRPVDNLVVDNPLRRSRRKASIESFDDGLVQARNVAKSSPTSDIPSSDDDPFIGQVTPHHLISPTLTKLSFNPPTSHDPFRDSPQSRLRPRARKPLAMAGPLFLEGSGPDSSPTRQVAARLKMRPRATTKRKSEAIS